MREQRFRHGRKGKALRPFLLSAQVKPRGCSRLLQRALTDFGADVPFGQVPKKVKEHYGIEVPIQAARDITQKHGAAMLQQVLQPEIPDREGVAVVIAELDGSLIPIVQTAAPELGRDRRKTRVLDWQEARLALAYRYGSVTPRFGATLGGVEQAGTHWADCVVRAGAGRQTRIHCVSDGAAWIAQQADQRFGTQARFLIDFYHLCDYLHAAAASCAPAQPQAWMQQQKQRLKANQPEAVLDALAPFLERDRSRPREQAPVQACYRYIDNRPGQFDYQGALAAGLPIGSGEVESAHRYVIQDRLKRAGAWWKEENAAKMLALRVVRANNEWDAYWQNLQLAAA